MNELRDAIARAIFDFEWQGRADESQWERDSAYFGLNADVCLTVLRHTLQQHPTATLRELGLVRAKYGDGTAMDHLGKALFEFAPPE